MAEKIFRVTQKQLEEIDTGKLNDLIHSLISIGCQLGQSKITKVQGGYFNEEKSEKIYIISHEPEATRKSERF